MWVKICGLTSAEAVAATVSCGADAIGFVFAPSVRQVTAAQAAEYARGAPKRMMRVAVMKHPEQALLDEVCATFRPDALQTDVEDFDRLRVPDGLLTIPVFRDGHALRERLPARLLYEGKVSGAGSTADWNAAARLAAQTEVILAGGLNSANVRAAIESVRPFGVDVSSGVERAPGVKDAALIEAFVRAAREAGA